MVRAAMHRTATVALSIGFCLACSQPSPTTQTAKRSSESDKASTPEPTPPPPPQPKPQPDIVRKDLVAEELPPVPSLDVQTVESSASGQFEWPSGADELAPRAVVAIHDGLLFVGQSYRGRVIGRPSPTWRWRGVVPTAGASTSAEEGSGAIRAAIVGPDGGALLAGTSGDTENFRGWFAIADGHGTLELQVDLDSPSATELFDLIPGRQAGELAVVGGYVDAQGWLVSLDQAGGERWQKFIGSYGYTQVRALTRLDRELLVVGTRAQQFGESWWARAPANGGADPSPADVTQDKLTIDGADQHQMLRAVVSLGDAGSIALGTAKRNYIQAHDQVVLVGFDAKGQPSWSKVLDDVRVTDVYGGRADDGAARFVVGVPSSSAGKPPALAVIEVSADGSAATKQLSDSEGWQSVGFIEGASTSSLIGWAPTGTGIQWRRLEL